MFGGGRLVMWCRMRHACTWRVYSSRRTFPQQQSILSLPGATPRLPSYRSEHGEAMGIHGYVGQIEVVMPC
jgi:hypothetical protein